MDTLAKRLGNNYRPVGKRLLKVPEVARRLGISVSAVYEAARQNRIGGLVRVGRCVRFDSERFEDWLDKGGQALPGGWRNSS